MSMLTPEYIYMSNLVGCYFIDVERFVDLDSLSADDHVFGDLYKIQPTQQSIIKMFEARAGLQEITKCDFGFNALKWHNFLLNPPKPELGYMKWPIPGGSPAVEIGMVIGIPRQKQLQRIATLLLNCSKYSKFKIF